jgi:hypothetical protein
MRSFSERIFRISKQIHRSKLKSLDLDITTTISANIKKLLIEEYSPSKISIAIYRPFNMTVSHPLWEVTEQRQGKSKD